MDDYRVAVLKAALDQGQRHATIAKTLGVTPGRVSQLIAQHRLEGHVLKHPEVYAMEQRHRAQEAALQSRLDVRARQRAAKEAVAMLRERRPVGRPRKPR